MIPMEYTYNIHILNSILGGKGNLLHPVIYSGDIRHCSDGGLDEVM